MAATKTRVAVNKIILHRNGVRVTIKANQKFDFTQEELDGLPKGSVRTIVNEDDTLQSVKVPAAANAKGGKQKGGKQEQESKPEGDGKPAGEGAGGAGGDEDL